MPAYTYETIIVFLLLLWLLGAFISPFGGDIIHLILLVVVVAIVLRFMQGRNTPL